MCLSRPSSSSQLILALPDPFRQLLCQGQLAPTSSPPSPAPTGDLLINICTTLPPNRIAPAKPSRVAGPPHPNHVSARVAREPCARAKNSIKQRSGVAGRPKRFGRHANQPSSLRFWPLATCSRPGCCYLRPFAARSRSGCCDLRALRTCSHPNLGRPSVSATDSR